jgi:hypothetical protein
MASINKLCNAKVGERDTPILVAQEVVRFDITVNQMLLMGMIAGGCDLLEDHCYAAAGVAQLSTTGGGAGRADDGEAEGGEYGGGSATAE